MSILVALHLVVLGAGAAAAPPPAMPDTVSPEAPVEMDSIRVLRGARQAQFAFERLRRSALPWTRAGGASRCDEFIGRFCLTFSGDPDADWEPPEEPEHIRAARHDLIDALANARVHVPGDAWLVGQTVRYLNEAGRAYEASTVSETCRAAPEWCGPLRGYVLYQAGDIEAAEAAFDSALARMEPEEREWWESVDDLLDDRQRRRVRAMTEEERAAWRERFWWLSDPLHSEPGNSRRAEHFVRRLMIRIHRESRTTDAVPWGRDLETLTVRYGVPVGHERLRSHHPTLGFERGIVSRYEPRRRFFLPDGEVVDDLVGTGDAWDLRRDKPTSVHRPPGIERFEPVQGFHHAVFRRGPDTLLVAVSYALDAMAEADGGGETWRSALVASMSPAGPRAEARREGGEAGALGVRTVAGRQVLSLEAFGGEGEVRRARWIAEPRPFHASVFDLSDVLPLDPSYPPRADARLEDLLDVAGGPGRLRAGAPLALVWEVYGPVRRTTEMEVSITLHPEDRGLLRRIGEALGLAGPVRIPSVRWGEAFHADEEGRALRAVEIRLPDDLSPGAYRLRLTATLPGQRPIVREQRLVVR